MEVHKMGHENEQNNKMKQRMRKVTTNFGIFLETPVDSF
jgi:hypothetical protein